MKKESQQHTITVSYTNEDNGIWLFCTCGWEDQVPNNEFFPTIQELSGLASKHWNAAPRNLLTERQDNDGTEASDTA